MTGRQRHHAVLLDHTPRLCAERRVLSMRIGRRQRGESVTRSVAPHCLRLVDGLVRGEDPREVAVEFVLERANLGDPLDHCLSDLDNAFVAVSGRAAPPCVVRAAATVWGETTQAHYNNVECLDPLTGLASRQHLLTQLSLIYRSAGAQQATRRPEGYRLLIVDLAELPTVELVGPVSLEASLRQLAAAEIIRGEEPTANTHAQLTANRSVVLLTTQTGSDDLERSLRELIDERFAAVPQWGHCTIESRDLPASFAEARRLIDGLCQLP